MQVKKQELELEMEQQTDSKFGKEYIKAVYCHLAYLTYMHNLFNLYAEDIMRNAGLVNYKLESRFLGEMSKPHICRWHHTYGR